MRSIVAGHQKLTMTNSEPLSKLILLKLHEKFPKNSTSASLWSFGIWIKLERWKSLISGCLMNWLKFFKNCHFEVLSFLILHNDKPFLDQMWYVMKSVFYLTTADDKLSGWTEKKLQSTSQNQTCTEKRSWSVIGVVLQIWSTTAFWIPAKPLHLRSMLSKLMRCTENYNACTWYWSKEWVQFFSMTMPNHMSRNQHFKSWMSWAVSSAIFTWSLAHWWLLLQASWQPAASRKCFPRIRRIPKHRFLHYRNKQT